ncbi:MAG: FAD-dependent oxidoreductase [Candidatus Helarchaeota archaeon]
MPKLDFDVIIIGGGCTGAGMVRDCALRGLNALMIERGDISSETTGTCAGMISGGVKYLLEPKIVAQCARESLIIWHIAHNIMFRTPILWTITSRKMRKMAKAMVLAYSDFLKMREGGKIFEVSREEALRMEPRLSERVGGAVFFEELFVDPWRLVLHSVLDAENHGAKIMTYTRVISLLKNNDTVYGVRVQNMKTNEIKDITAKYVVNAAGPWVPQICRMADIDYKLRLNKGSHIIFDRRVSNIGLVCPAYDGRNAYMFPHENTTILGVTAIDVFDDPDNIKPEYNDVEYLLSSMETIIPDLRKHRVIRTFVGVRPMLYKYGVEEGDVSRGFKVIDHEKKHDIKGFITIAGGKLVTHRLMAKKTTDLICKKLGIEKECSTASTPLPGAGNVDIELLSEKYKMDYHVTKRIAVRHGSITESILSKLNERQDLKSTICTCESATNLEMRYCIQNEHALHLDDLRRRLRIGSGPCQGTGCIFKAITVLNDELNYDIDESNVDLLDFLNERWKGIWPALRGEQLSEGELSQGIYGCVGNFNDPYFIPKNKYRSYKV